MGRVYSAGVDSLSFSGCKNVVMTFLAVLFTAAHSGDAQFHHPLPPNDYPEIIPRHSEMQLMSGREVKLNCNVYSCSGKRFKWEFLPCGRDYFSKCPSVQFEDEKWRRLYGNIRNKNCSSNFNVITKSSNDSGLYRCLLIDEKDFSYRIIKIFHLTVVDKVQISHGSTPNVLEFQPSNVTVYREMRIVIQCKVYSILPVEIRWFKEDQNGFIYKNVSYVMLNYSQHVYIDRDIYLSKLIIDRAYENDSGVYMCAAINSLGPVFRTANVTVLSYPLSKEYRESNSFYLLFLIPLGLALLPVIVWLCYYRKKKKNDRRIRNENDLAKDETKYYYVF